MGPTLPAAGAALQRQAMLAENAQNPLAIDRGQPCRPAVPVQKRGDAPVAVGRPGIDETAQSGQQLGIG